MMKQTEATTRTPSRARSTGLGELISAVYTEFLAIYGDPELASVAAAAVINDLLSAGAGEGVTDSGGVAVA